MGEKRSEEKYSRCGSDGGSLEAESDRLLRKSGCFNRISGIYTEEQISRARKRGREIPLDETFDHRQFPAKNERMVSALYECYWQEVISGAHKMNCSIRQIDFLELRRFGYSYGDIADMKKDTYKCSADTVERDIKCAAVAIQKIPSFGLWSVLAEVFKTSVERIKYILISD